MENITFYSLALNLIIILRFIYVCKMCHFKNAKIWLSSGVKTVYSRWLYYIQKSFSLIEV